MKKVLTTGYLSILEIFYQNQSKNRTISERTSSLLYTVRTPLHFLFGSIFLRTNYALPVIRHRNRLAALLSHGAIILSLRSRV